MQKAFKIEGMEKSYPGFQLGPVNLELEPGVVLGFIGPNGAGKTTTINCLAGLLKKDQGSIEIFGRENSHNSPEWKLDIGYVGDIQAFYENWTCEKNLLVLSQFYPDWSDKLTYDLAKRFDIPLKKKVKELSRGNRVKLSLISALSHSPKLLLLDEPTSGLDPVVRSEVLDALFEVVESEERAIFYSTHILSDISRLADDLAFIVNGKILMKARKDDLTEKWRQVSFRLEKDRSDFEGAINHKTDGKNHQIVTADYEASLKFLTKIGAENILEYRMSIDEIAVFILKENRHVESD